MNYHSEKSFSAKHLDIILKSGLTVNQQSENKMWWSILCQSPTTTFEEKPSSKVFNSSNRCDVEKKPTTQLKTRKKKLLRNYKESRIKKMASDLREKHAIAMPYFICYMLMLYSATTFLKMFTPFVLQVLFCFVLLCLKEL